MSKVGFASSVGWLALLACMPAWPAHYSVIEIPAPLTLAVGLNDNGDVIGEPPPARLDTLQAPFCIDTAVAS